MKKKIILAVATVAVATMSAKAQTLYAQAGEIVAISSLTDATSQGGVTYQWYRNDVLIPGCTEATCAVPASLATGTNVQFYRRAIALGCAIGNTSNTNTVTITFCNVVQNGVCWGDTPVSGWRTVAAKPDVYSVFFQFNRTKVWNDSHVPSWSTINENAYWHVDSSPCPNGWRLPTREEYRDLHNNNKPAGGVWAAENSRGNSVAGRFYGSRSIVCSLPDDMVGCVFLSASGGRTDWSYDLGVRGYYWSSTQYNNTDASVCEFSSTYAYADNSSTNNKSSGYSIRCVR